MFHSAKQAALGTKYHDLAASMIELGVQPAEAETTFNMYVRDALGYRMTPEQPLFYSSNIFGTADAICCRHNILRIHDLKMGVNPTDMRQLYSYGALFCLEYHIKPFELDAIIVRIYQNDAIKEETVDPELIVRLMEHIKWLDKRLSELRAEP